MAAMLSVVAVSLFLFISHAQGHAIPSAAPSLSSLYTEATIYYEESTGYHVKYGVMDKDDGVAYASYNRTQNETGWAILNLAAGYSTNHKYSDRVVMYAAGMLEGVMTQPDIYDTYRNQFEFWFKDAPQETLKKAMAFYSDQREWMEEMIGTHQATDKTWQFVDLVYQQYKGLIDGYSRTAPTNQHVDDFGFDILSGNGDWLDIQNIIDEGFFRNKMRHFPRGQCSALVKILPGYENVYASHSTWYIYSSMLRTYKHYSFKVFDEDQTASKTMSFSSYPGYLCSLDDFYIMDSQLVMLQTTNSIDNSQLYSKATPHALLAWHRVRLANWLADNGRDWAEYIRQYNSGTYNNQYIVLDMKKVHLKNGIKDDALWIVEQIPGLVEAADETAILREGYWASYNVPFFTNISRMSGIPDSVNKYGPERSHDLAPRAKIFRRDQGTVHSFKSMQAIMRYNGYKLDDPYAEGSPMKAICSRGDLSMPHPSAGGCTDTKVTDYFLVKEMTAGIISGPTTTNSLPVFDWSQNNLTNPHHGQPTRFNFDWIMQSPKL